MVTSDLYFVLDLVDPTYKHNIFCLDTRSDVFPRWWFSLALGYCLVLLKKNSRRLLDALVDSISIYIPSLPEGADKDAIRNVFAGLVEAQRYDTSLRDWDYSGV